MFQKRYCEISRCGCISSRCKIQLLETRSIIVRICFESFWPRPLSRSPTFSMLCSARGAGRVESLAHAGPCSARSYRKALLLFLPGKAHCLAMPMMTLIVDLILVIVHVACLMFLLKVPITKLHLCIVVQTVSVMS